MGGGLIGMAALGRWPVAEIPYYFCDALLVILIVQSLITCNNLICNLPTLFKWLANNKLSTRNWCEMINHVRHSRNSPNMRKFFSA